MKPPFPEDSWFNCMQSLMSAKPGVSAKGAGRLGCASAAQPRRGHGRSAVLLPAAPASLRPGAPYTYPTSSRWPLACPGEPPAGRAGGKQFSSPRLPPSQRSRPGLRRSRDRPPRSVPPGRETPASPDRGRLPATGGRLGAAPNLPQEPAGAWPAPPLFPPELLKQARAAPLRASPASHSGAHTAPRIRWRG